MTELVDKNVVVGVLAVLDRENELKVETAVKMVRGLTPERKQMQLRKIFHPGRVYETSYMYQCSICLAYFPAFGRTPLFCPFCGNENGGE